ncbi:cation diffusion facilitator family transporter [Streptomyces sp. HB2AG]|uniref:cation diffusion facilitator family transporter n=1 Tax=Streptomyces sp. HB2AG TaxID=2983400 RepID=UPI0022AB4A9F|nr:cation diffusion facilitator family transporter [Streptomyces sp. HB2AG]MCZ2524636.1 cation diffusion facilitator family transporter [Streptomyces sp. HB2AG]
MSTKDGETKGTVFVALGANLVIAAAKAAGGLMTGSPALLSESAHSVADSLNEVFLLAALRRSRRRPDAKHPFGYGKERFFWSLLAAVGIFVMGGCFSFYQGLHALTSGESESGGTGGYAVAVAVLVVALLAEGTSLAKALVQVRGDARRAGRGFRAELRAGDDPALRTVVAEDGTAVLGVLLALTGIGLHLATGELYWEAAASIGIALLLMYVAYRLGRETRDVLVGTATSPELQQQARDLLEEQPEVDTVTHLLTMRLGTDSTLLAARVDLVEGVAGEDVEEASDRVKRQISEACPEFDQVFLDITRASAADRRRAARDRAELDRAVAAREQA